MTANAEAFQLNEDQLSSSIKQHNANRVAGALILACDLLDEKGVGLSAPELEFVGHARDLAEGVRQ